MAQALGMFKRRFEHFVKHAHRLPSMLATALAPDALAAARLG